LWKQTRGPTPPDRMTRSAEKRRMPPDMVESEYQGRREALDRALTSEWKRIRKALEPIVASKVHRRAKEYWDVFEETLSLCMADLIKQAAKYEPDRDVVPWAVRFAIRSLMEVLRKRGKSRRTPAATDVGEAWEQAEASFQALHEQEHAELREEIQLALGKLTNDQRRLIELMHLQGLSYDELYEAVGGSRTGLKMRVSRARQAFAKVFRRPGREEDSE
ncbi:MAG TPA: sigma-70 family RNA polymerase sigma factor, partial [Pirellulales bacterium]